MLRDSRAKYARIRNIRRTNHYKEPICHISAGPCGFDGSFGESYFVIFVLPKYKYLKKSNMETLAGKQLVWYRCAMSTDLDVKNTNEKKKLVNMR
jgi:hypothetical protein